MDETIIGKEIVGGMLNTTVPYFLVLYFSLAILAAWREKMLHGQVFYVLKPKASQGARREAISVVFYKTDVHITPLNPITLIFTKVQPRA